MMCQNYKSKQTIKSFMDAINYIKAYEEFIVVGSNDLTFKIINFEDGLIHFSFSFTSQV